MAPSYIAGAVVVLATVLPMIGIQVGTEQLTTTIATLLQIGGGLVVVIRQIMAGRATIYGSRPAGFNK